MRETKSYVDMLVNSLKKKYDTLLELEKLEKKQEALLQEEVTPEKIDNILNAKNDNMNKLEDLDLGFEKLYERAREDIAENKELYKEEIIKMQDLIRNISDLTASLRAMQTRNKERYMAFFDNKKHEVKQFKRSSNTVSNYYKNMYNSHQEGSSYFLDKKK